MQLAAIGSLQADFFLSDRKFGKNTKGVLFSYKKSGLIELWSALF